MISAFGRKEVGNFSFTPSLVGNYNETMVVENVLDSFNDQNVSVKATVRKQPTFSVEPATTLDFGTVDTASDKIAPMSFILTNVFEEEQTFVVQVAPREGCFADVILSRDESMRGRRCPKPRKRRRKGCSRNSRLLGGRARRKDSKYETRSSELGVTSTSGQDDEAWEASRREGAEKQDSYSRREGRQVGANTTEQGDKEQGRQGRARHDTVRFRFQFRFQVLPVPVPCPCRLYPDQYRATTPSPITLQPNRRTKILVELVSRSCGVGGGPLATTIRVHEKKNTDETAGLVVTAAPMSAGGI